MARIEITEAPEGAAAKIVAAAKAAVTVTDARGRAITLKKPGPWAQYELVEAAGDNATNKVWMGMVMPLIFVISIDGEPVVTPATKDEIKALVARLDEDGIDAVMNGAQEHFGSVAQGDGEKK